MLRHRIEGLVGLHSASLFLLVAAAFFATLLGLQLTQVVVFNEDVNFPLYFFAALAAMTWTHRHLRAGAQSYGRLSTPENLRLTAHQMTRLSLAVFAIAFVTKDTHLSRVFLLTFLGLSGVLVLTANLFLPPVLAKIFFRDTAFRTVIVGAPDESLSLGAWMRKYSDIGVEVVGYVSDQPSSRAGLLPWLGKPSDLPEIVDAAVLDQVLINQRSFDSETVRSMTETCEHLGCRVRCFVDITSLLPIAPTSVEQDGRYAFASFTAEPLDNPVNRVAKRLLDIAVSLPVVLFVLPPVLLVTAIFQRLQSPGPVLYRQIRSGLNRRQFYIYKLRTMHVDNGARVAQQATRGDSRIYKFGAFLRRSSLDELPQFLNVLRGEMSVSGPRPHLTQHDEAFARVISTYRKRHFVKPGITGLAQSKGYRGEVGETRLIMKRVRYDMHYVAKWSLGMDIRIIFNTIRQIIVPPPSAY